MAGGTGGPASKAEDHRSRVGRERRGRTRARIVESALEVFARMGADAPVIDDFISAAGIAHGTFYNHFASTQELLEAVSATLEDDLIASITAAIGGLDDPLARVATGVRLWLARARVDPLWCGFVARVRQRGSAVERELGRDLRAGIRTGAFAIGDARAARDLVVGAIREAMARMSGERVPAAFTERVVRAVLLGLGAQRERVDEALARPLPPIRAPARAAPAGRAKRAASPAAR